MKSSNAFDQCHAFRKRPAASSSGQEELAPGVKIPRTEEESCVKIPTTHINDLPGELLGRVISELEARERVFSESVCRRWNRVSRTYGWLKFRLIADEQWSYLWKHANWRSHRDAELAGVVERELKCLLSRCTPAVCEISLDGLQQYGLDGRVCELLTDGMRQLETLTLDRVPLNSSQLVGIGARLPWLRTLSLKGCYENTETGFSNALASLLTSSRHLESLSLGGTCALIDNHRFSSLPATLRRLDISNCSNIHHSVVDSLLTTCAGNLMELRMGGLGVLLDGWTNGHLERLFAGLGNLEELHFWEFLNTRNRNGALGEDVEEDVSSRLECLGTLRNLRRLSLCCDQSLTSEVLDRIVDGCRGLESLELLCCHRAGISKAAVGRLAQLPKLTLLRLDRHLSIEDDTLAVLAKGPACLRGLSVFACKKVTDKGIAHLLNGCGGQLRDLNVAFCPLVTHATVAKLKALYNDASNSDDADEGRVFVLRADATNLGFDYKEFGGTIRRVK